ncbi:hypothetical protein CLF_107818 [Clonorchis sinensis]|uniref:Reverse transcriptase domain-containing protein n=1 Tax=Clonorchis sinensis TaxID=79923 RepID=G7YH81_CLOSI|nr:hypothetical protein CLF_107818 [Clonorchis sinensis]
MSRSSQPSLVYIVTITIDSNTIACEKKLVDLEYADDIVLVFEEEKAHVFLDELIKVKAVRTNKVTSVLGVSRDFFFRKRTNHATKPCLARNLDPEVSSRHLSEIAEPNALSGYNNVYENEMLRRCRIDRPNVINTQSLVERQEKFGVRGPHKLRIAQTD